MSDLASDNEAKHAYHHPHCICVLTGKGKESSDWPNWYNRQWGTIKGALLFWKKYLFIFLSVFSVHSHNTWFQKMSNLLPERELDEKKITNLSQQVKALQVFVFPINVLLESSVDYLCPLVWHKHTHSHTNTHTTTMTSMWYNYNFNYHFSLLLGVARTRGDKNATRWENCNY